MSLLQKNNGGKRLSRTIDYSEIKFMDTQVMGSGGFGKVFVGYLNGKKIGIKKMTIYENDPNQDTLLKFIEREIASLKMVSHPNVIQFYGIAEKERSFFLLTELVAGGDLHWYIRNPEIRMSWKLKLLIARDIAASMVYLHNNNIVHRDLKSTNLLVAENWVIKVCDFGLAKKLDLSSKLQMTICGTDDWCAPEVLLGETYDKSCDVFSFGIVLVELITRLKLTPRIRNEDLGVDIDFIKTRTPKDCPSQLIDLIIHCCRENHHLRPTFEQIENLLNYLINVELKDLELEELPPLRSFQPPELTMAQITPNQSFPRPYVPSNTTDKSKKGTLQSSNSIPRPPSSLQSSLSSFPRPYVPSEGDPSTNVGPISSSPSNFSFPRPYQGSPSSSLGSSAPISVLSSSPFSFPLPYEPTEDEINENFLIEDNYQQQEQFEEYHQDEEPVEYIYADSVVSFHDSELLSFPRPYQPPDQVQPINRGPLLIQTDYSFPRPWNPENDKLSSIISPVNNQINYVDTNSNNLKNTNSISNNSNININSNSSNNINNNSSNNNDNFKNNLKINIVKEKIDDNQKVNAVQTITSPLLSTPIHSSLSPPTPKSNISSTQSTPNCTPNSTPTKTPNSPFVTTPKKTTTPAIALSLSPPVKNNNESVSPPHSPQKSHISIQDRIKKLLKGGSSKNMNSNSKEPRKSINTKDIIQKYEEITKFAQTQTPISPRGNT